MHIEIDIFEIITLLFFLTFFKWLFRFIIIALIGKLVSNLKEKGSNSLKEFQENMKKGE